MEFLTARRISIEDAIYLIMSPWRKAAGCREDAEHVFWPNVNYLFIDGKYVCP
eukprot:SAG31_NODE_1613_length_7743_cov_5.584903_5_plen_53_part_00